METTSSRALRLALRPADFGKYEHQIRHAFENLFGGPWDATLPDPFLDLLRSRLVEHSTHAEDLFEDRATTLVRDAYALRDKIVALLEEPGFPRAQWAYLERLASDLLIFDTLNAQDGALAVAPEAPLEIQPEPCDLVAQRRATVARLASSFRNHWPLLPTSAGGSTSTGKRPRNQLARGIAAALVFGGYFACDAGAVSDTDRNRFASLIRIVKLDLDRLGRDGHFHVHEHVREEALALDQEGLPTTVLIVNGPVADLPGGESGFLRRLRLKKA